MKPLHYPISGERWSDRDTINLIRKLERKIEILQARLDMLLEREGMCSVDEEEGFWEEEGK